MLSLNSWFAGIEDNKLLCLATLLDPRFKDKFFANNIIRASAQDMLEEELQVDLVQMSENMVQLISNFKTTRMCIHTCTTRAPLESIRACVDTGN